MATRRSQARRYQAAARSTRRSLQAARRSTRQSLQTNPLAGWLAAGALLIVLAFVVGGPAAEQGLLGSRSSPTPSAGAAIPIRFGLALDPDTNRAIRAGPSLRGGPALRLLRDPAGAARHIDHLRGGRATQRRDTADRPGAVSPADRGGTPDLRLDAAHRTTFWRHGARDCSRCGSSWDRGGRRSRPDASGWSPP